MEQTNYDKLHCDITKNKHFTMIEQPGPSKHLSALKDRYRCKQRLQTLRLAHRGHPQESDRTFFEKYFQIIPALDNYLSERVPQETENDQN